MYQLHNDSRHSSDARRDFNIFLSLFGGLMAIAAILGSIMQAVISGSEFQVLPLLIFAAAALGLVNIGWFLLDERQDEFAHLPQVSESDECSLEATGEHISREYR
jgi:hypothetical protein